MRRHFLIFLSLLLAGFQAFGQRGLSIGQYGNAKIVGPVDAVTNFAPQNGIPQTNSTTANGDVPLFWNGQWLFVSSNDFSVDALTGNAYNAVVLGADPTATVDNSDLFSSATFATNIYFPPGFYKCNAVFHAGKWQGAWAGTPNQTGGLLLNYGDDPGTVFIPANTNLPVLTIGNNAFGISNAVLDGIWVNGWTGHGTNMASVGIFMGGGSHQTHIEHFTISGCRTNFSYGVNSTLFSCDQNTLANSYLLGGGTLTNTVDIFEQGYNGTGPNGHTFATELDLVNTHIQVSASGWSNGCWAIYDDSVDNKWVGSKLDSGAGSGVARPGKYCNVVYLTNSIAGATAPLQNGDNVSEWDDNQGSYATNITCVLGYANGSTSWTKWVFGMHVYGAFLFSDGSITYADSGSLRFHTMLDFPETSQLNFTDSSVNYGTIDDLTYIQRSHGVMSFSATNSGFGAYAFRDWNGSNFFDFGNSGGTFRGTLTIESNETVGGIIDAGGVRTTNTQYFASTDTNGQFVGLLSIHNDNQVWLVGTANQQINIDAGSNIRLLAGGVAIMRVESNGDLNIGALGEGGCYFSNAVTGYSGFSSKATNTFTITSTGWTNNTTNVVKLEATTGTAIQWTNLSIGLGATYGTITVPTEITLKVNEAIFGTGIVVGRAISL